jgi:hypothetical protein
MFVVMCKYSQEDVSFDLTAFSNMDDVNDFINDFKNLGQELYELQVFQTTKL